MYKKREGKPDLGELIGSAQDPRLHEQYNQAANLRTTVTVLQYIHPNFVLYLFNSPQHRSD
jgi:hypothetical protein